MSGRCRILRGDALCQLQSMPSASVDLVLTDPPYSSGGAFRGDRTATTTAKYCDSDYNGAAALPAFAGDNRDQRSYLMWCTLWLQQALRVARPGAIVAVFIDWRQLPVMTDAVQCAGWVWRGVASWQKSVARPQRGRPYQDTEFIVWGTAGPRAMAGVPGPRGHRSAPPRDRKHQTQKPVALLQEWCSLAPSDGLILDPFTGSGSTAVAALSTGRRFLGVELAEEYIQIAQQRIADEVEPLRGEA